MSKAHGRTMPVLLAAVALVGGANAVAYAANGRPLLLGSDNHESRTATVHNTGAGPALSLRTRPGAPPLSVTSDRRVPALNADRVDGLDAAALRTTSWTYLFASENDEGPDVVRGFPGLPPGRYLVSYTVVASLIGGDGVPLSCWLTTATEPKAVYSVSTQAGGMVSVSATGYVDTTRGVTLTLHSAASFNIYPQRAGDPESSVTFTRLDSSSVQQAGSVP